MGIGHIATGFAAKRAVPRVPLAVLLFAATFVDVLWGAFVLGVLVLGHWVLDVVSHRPDMPVFLKGPYIGLGLWNSLPASILVEEAMLASGVVLYVKATKGGANLGLGILVAILAVMGVAGYLA